MRTARGYTLIEILIVMGIVGVAIGLMLAGPGSRATGNAEVMHFSSEIIALSDRLRALSSGTGFEDVSVTDGVAVLDPSWVVTPGSSVQRHSLGGVFVLAKANYYVTGNLFDLDARNLTPAQCVKIIQQTHSRAFRIIINGTYVKLSADAVPIDSAVRTNCYANTAPRIRWLLLR